MLFQGTFGCKSLLCPEVENTFYSTKNLALSERMGFGKIQDDVFEQTLGNFVNFDKKKFFDIVIAT